MQAECGNALPPPTAKLDFVIAHYAEGGNETSQLLREIMDHPCMNWTTPRVIMLCKSTEEKFNSLRSQKGFEQFNVEWLRLNNTGREGDSYLRYIINNYHNLPDYVLFAQAGLHEQHSLHKRLSNFGASVHYMSLSFTSPFKGKIEGQQEPGIGCSCDFGCYGHVEGSPVFFQLYALSAKRLCPPGHVFPTFWNGQFIVRREGILRHERAFYEYMLFLVNGES